MEWCSECDRDVSTSETAAQTQLDYRRAVYAYPRVCVGGGGGGGEEPKGDECILNTVRVGEVFTPISVSHCGKLELSLDLFSLGQWEERHLSYSQVTGLLTV